jgi:hypothetical protein
MKYRPPLLSAQRSAKEHKNQQMNLPTPVTSLWLILHDPEAFRRNVLARCMMVQRARSRLIRPVRPIVSGVMPPRRLERLQVHHAGHNQAPEREHTLVASSWSDSRPDAALINVDHHDFASRFRDR